MNKKELWIFILSVAGVLFAGYLSGVKFFKETCAFNESCPYVLGFPACYYGFFMFLTLFIVSLLLILKKYDPKILLKIIFGVSIAGILFAGVLSFQELISPSTYALGLPTCAYGFIVYLIILVISGKLVFSK